LESGTALGRAYVDFLPKTDPGGYGLESLPPNPGYGLWKEACLKSGAAAWEAGRAPERPPSASTGQPETPTLPAWAVEEAGPKSELTAWGSAVQGAGRARARGQRRRVRAAQVGLVTYGTHVHVHELGFTECAKSYVFQARGAPALARRILPTLTLIPARTTPCPPARPAARSPPALRDRGACLRPAAEAPPSAVLADCWPARLARVRRAWRAPGTKPARSCSAVRFEV